MALINEEAQMKELRLQDLKYASGNEVAINVNCKFLNRLKENVGDYFYIANTKKNGGKHIVFSPRQAFDIYNRLFNTIYPSFGGIILPLTEGYCKIVRNIKKEDMKLLFIDNSMNRILYQINSF